MCFAPRSLRRFLARLSGFSARFPSRAIDGTPETADEFPIVENVGADSVLQGIEAHADVNLTAAVALNWDSTDVHGSLTHSGVPLPRIPPLRGRIGLRYQHNAFQTGGEVTMTATQDRVFVTETPTDGYQVVRLFGSVLNRSRRPVAHADSTTGQRHQRAVSQSPVADQRPCTGDGTELQAAL